MSRKRNNKYPFIILLVIHTSLLLFTFLKKKDRKSLAVLLFSNMGFAYLFEFIVLNIFQAYNYKPRILKKRYQDNILGAILSQAVYIPFAALFITAFQLKWKGKVFFVTYFYIVERTFEKLRVYKTIWWRPLITTILLPVYFSLSDYWYKHLRNGTRFVLLSSLFLAIMGTGVNILFLGAVFRNFRFGRGLIHSWKEHFIIAPLYCISLSLFTTWSIQREGWLGKARALLFALGVDWILYRRGIVKINFKIPFLNVLTHVLMIFLSKYYSKLIFKGVRSEYPQTIYEQQKSQ